MAQEDCKKLPETLAEIRQDWAKNEPIRLMFQDEARFGRIKDVRRCWVPKPVRPQCQAMTPRVHLRVRGGGGQKWRARFFDLAARQYRLHAVVSR
ncbi:hypothetical protein NTG1052_320014 [Candidatus Nitrotoga sp. 1052]|nr:hypothetical protein NTG1052_210004 [Candidatus Nitrotoga sp. 1052]CAH1078571.1 hypothetical protein NTG1052_320014 [Candidatus Nitrotoga sp. 1052]